MRSICNDKVSSSDEVVRYIEIAAASFRESLICEWDCSQSVGAIQDNSGDQAV